MTILEAHELVGKPAPVAPEVSETLPDASGANVILTSSVLDGTKGSQLDKDKVLDELGVLVDHDNRVEKADITWKDGKLSIQGPVTRLGLTIGGMLVALGMVVYTGHPVTHAYLPMTGIGVVALVSSYVEKGNK